MCFIYYLLMYYCRPSILSLNTCIYPTCVTLTYCSPIAPLGLFRLTRSPSLRWACMWSIECVCSSLRSVIMASFFFFQLLASCHRKQVRSPEVLTQSEFIRVCRIWSTWDCFNHISLTRTQNHAPFLLLDSLLIEEFSEKN